MQATTREDRAKELLTLLNAMKAHPERDWTAERQRANVLREMLARQDATVA
jgi:hypothetical protein